MGRGGKLTATDWQRVIDGYIDGIADKLCTIRRYLHAHPEPSGGEFQTALYIAQRLKEAGIAHRVIPSQRGVVTEHAKPGGAPVVALRADMDALRLQDAKEVPYRSSHEGVMHACGHDAHCAMVMGASLALHHCRESLPWPTGWRSLFQPAEETSEGALEMVQAGAVQDTDAIVALHVDPELAVGRVAVRHGPLTAFCAGIDVAIRGHGGHAARPHHTIDPIAVAIQFVNSIYQFVPRSIDSREPTVVSFGVFEGGKNPNTIPPLVRLSGTIRTMSSVGAKQVKERIRGIAHGLQEASGAQIDVSFSPGPDAVINDPLVTDVCAYAATSVVGKDHVDTLRMPSMGGEDFSAYLVHVPGCMLRLGVAGPSGPRHFLHSPDFDIDERALAIGAKILARAAVLLARPQK